MKIYIFKLKNGKIIELKDDELANTRAGVCHHKMRTPSRVEVGMGLIDKADSEFILKNNLQSDALNFYSPVLTINKKDI